VDGSLAKQLGKNSSSPCSPLQPTSIGNLAFWLINAEARKTRRAQPNVTSIGRLLKSAVLVH
jgi:hypothetical protein